MKFFIDIKILMYLLLGMFFFVSCSTKDPIVVSKEPETPNPGDNTDVTYSSDYAYNLNVIYFVPKNVTPNPGYEERLSKIMIEGQKFVSKWMNHWGYGDKTFGLLKNQANNLIKIHVVHGPDLASAYVDAAPIKKLVDDYFNKNPKEKSSDHYLILTATNKKLDQGEVIGHDVPFYGSGRYCYALDYPGMSQDNLGKSGDISWKATVYIGGLIHELGHGLNLPHNGPSASKIKDSAYGMTLMGSGNSTYGRTPTYLSHASAAILDVNQVFSKSAKTFYGNTTSSIQKIQASYNSSKLSIIMSGKFQASVPVKHILSYQDPNVNDEGVGVNKDYNAVAFAFKPIGLDSFYLEIPVSDLIQKDNGIQYESKIRFVHENGSITEKVYTYKFQGGIPIIDFGDREFLSRNGWSVINFSNEQNSGYYAAKNVLDGNPNTYWHTSWDNPADHPHFVQIKTGSNIITARGLSINTRHDNTGNGGKIKDFRLEISTDGLTWTTAYEGRMAINGVQYFTFSSPKTFRYFKVVSLNDYENKFHATLSEVNLY